MVFVQYQILISQDQQKVESIIEEISRRQSSDKVIAVEHLFHIHRNDYIPELVEIDRFIRDAILTFGSSKINLTHELVNKLVAVSHLQSVIASASPKLVQLNSTLHMHIQAFSQLLHVHRMGPSWGATLIEILRRKEYTRVFTTNVIFYTKINADRDQ